MAATETATSALTFLSPVEVLIHNVSHSDVVFTLESPPCGEEPASTHLLYPQFNFFNRACEQALRLLEQRASTLSHVRDEDNWRHLPLGFGATEDCSDLIAYRWEDFKFSRRVNENLGVDHSSATPPPSGTTPKFVNVLFPLLAAVMPRWFEALNVSSSDSGEDLSVAIKYLYLVSGGEKEDSTEQTSRLIGKFVETFYSSVRIVYVHSGGDIFKYDDNVVFVNQYLKPHLLKHRRDMAKAFNEEWPANLGVTLSLSEGAHARVSAIAACMREFRPNTIHMIRHRAFALKGRLDENDVEYHTFETTEMSPALAKEDLSPSHRLLVEQMIQYREEFLNMLKSENDLASFWLRKTGQPVLSVLMTQKEACEPVFYKSINLEVSMPTGSLCAERNSIGSALSGDLTLKRNEFLAIAVLSLPNLLKGEGPSLTTATTAVKTPTSRGGDDSVSVSFDGSKAPGRHFRRDKNPLSPCGACTEWLRKITALSPDFRILTFTDERCTKVFSNSVV